MKIAIGSDHGGHELKEMIVNYLQANGHEIVNCGCDSLESVDYPDFAENVCFEVRSGVCEGGILICGTGISLFFASGTQRSLPK